MERDAKVTMPPTDRYASLSIPLLSFRLFFSFSLSLYIYIYLYLYYLYFSVYVCLCLSVSFSDSLVLCRCLLFRLFLSFPFSLVPLSLSFCMSVCLYLSPLHVPFFRLRL